MYCSAFASDVDIPSTGTITLNPLIAAPVAVFNTAPWAEVPIIITHEKVTPWGVLVTSTTEYVEFIDCDFRGNLTGKIRNLANPDAVIRGRDSHALIEDHDYSGEWESAKVGETVAFGQLLYPDFTAGEWKKAKSFS